MEKREIKKTSKILSNQFSSLSMDNNALQNPLKDAPFFHINTPTIEPVN